MLSNKIRLILLSFVILLSFGNTISAQKVAVKTNLVTDALLNPSAAVEFGLTPRWTLEAGGEFNLWNGKHIWKHWALQPEARYWLCDRFGAHFFGFHVHGGQYNIGGISAFDFSFLGTDFAKLKDNRFQGWFAGAGVAYGYDWVLSRNWNLEAEIGIGYSYTRYDRFNCMGCGKKTASDVSHNYWGLTRLALNLVYIF